MRQENQNDKDKKQNTGGNTGRQGNQGGNRSTDIGKDATKKSNTDVDRK